MEQYIKWFENKVRVKLPTITINSITSDEMVSITHKKNLSNIPCGFVDRRNVSPTIWIRNDMSELQTQTTIFHELVHILLNEEYKKRLELLHNEDNEEQQMCLKITYDFWNEFVAEYFAVTAVSTKDEFHELSALINDMINNHDKRFIYAILAHLCAFYTETPINDIVPDISQKYVDRIESLKKACLNIIGEYSIENMWDIPDDKFNNEITENYLEMFFLILQKEAEES